MHITQGTIIGKEKLKIQFSVAVFAEKISLKTFHNLEEAKRLDR